MDRERVNEPGRTNEIDTPHRQVRVDDRVPGSDHAATDFTRAMTHELRTPLNVVIGLCEMLKRDGQSPLSPMQRDAVERMERNAQALLQSVNHLLGCLRTGRFE